MKSILRGQSYRLRRSAGSFFSIFALFSSATGLLQPQVAQATLLLYEGFDYSSSVTPSTPDNDADGHPDLNGLNGGSGFSSAWTETLYPNSSTGMTPLDYDYIQSGSLSFGNLAVSGSSMRSQAPQGFNSEDIRRVTTLPGTVGQTIWVSFLMRQNFVQTNSNYDAGFTLYSDSANPEGSPSISIGDAPGNPRFFGLTASGIDTSDDPAVSANNTNVAFLVTSITFAADAADIKLFINPTPGDQTPTAFNFALTTDFSLAHIDQAVFYSNALNPRSWDFDELRIGTTFADVAPIITPEPASAGLLGLGGLLLSARRRR